MAARVPRSTELLGSESVSSHDGAALFIDIDGFTALTDRLIGNGHEGVELLHNAMARAFGPILDRVDRSGGDVVHVIGDALIAVYSGEAPVENATDVALWSRGHLSQLELDGHQFSSTAAICGGRIVLRQLGDPLTQRQLVATGPAISTAMAAERAASSGSVVVAAGSVRGVPIVRSVDGPPPPSPHVLKARRVFAGDDRWLPTALRSDLTFPSQHKYSDTAFVSVRVRRDRWAAASDWYSSLVEECADEGVALLEADPLSTGFRLRLIMGAPVASGSHRSSLMVMARRAVDSAGSHGLVARAGVCGGRTFVGTIPGRRVRRTVVIGDPVNVAARIGALARPGQVLVERPTALRAGITPTAKPTRRQLRGKPGPTILAALNADDLGVRVSSPTPAFVGRERELELLRTWASPSCTERLGCVIGEAGIGKSTLIHAFTIDQSSEGPGLLVIEPDESDARRPLGLAGRLARSIAARIGDPMPNDMKGLKAWLDRWHIDVSDAWLDPLAVALGLETPPRRLGDDVGIADRVAGARHELRGIISALTSGRHIVVVIEDFYFVDPSSSTLINDLVSPAGGGSDGPRYIVVARPGQEDLHPLLRNGNRLDLEPLDDAAVRTLLASLGLADDRVETVVREAEGNPLYATELASIAESSDESELRLGLVGTVECRLDTMGIAQPGALDALRAAAAIGNSAPMTWVAQAVDRAGASSFTPAELAGLAGFARLEDGHITFRHHRIRDVVLRHMKGRRELHRALCRVIERDRNLPSRERALLLGDHATGSGDARLIWRFERSGANAAIEQLALPDAFDRLSRAARAGASLPGVSSSALCDTSVRAARLAEQLGQFDDADTLVTQALGTATTPTETARSLALAATLRRVHGDSDGALAACRMIRRLDLRPRGALRGELLLTEAAVHHRLGHFGECMQLAKRALAGSGLREAQRAKAMMLYDSASFDIDRTTRYEAEWVRLLEQVGDVRVIGDGYNDLAVNSYHLGNYRQSLDQSNEAIARFRIINDPTGEATAVCNKGEVLSDRGDLAGALECFTDGGRLWEQSAEVFGLAYLHRNLGRLAGRRREPARALRHFDDGEALFKEMGNDDELSEFLAARLEVEVRAGLKPRTWGRSLVELSRTSAPIDHHVVLRLTALVAERRGRTGDAYRSYRDAAAAAHDAGAFEEALSLLGAARTGPDEREAPRWRDMAEELLERMEIDRNGWISGDLARIDHVRNGNRSIG